MVKHLVPVNCEISFDLIMNFRSQKKRDGNFVAIDIANPISIANPICLVRSDYVETCSTCVSMI